MTTYRVGSAGATVFNAAGEVVGTLPSGHVVVEGVVTTPGSLADQHKRNVARQKVIRRYTEHHVVAEREQ